MLKLLWEILIFAFFIAIIYIRTTKSSKSSLIRQREKIMKIAYVAVNSKYIHTALAARYLKAYGEKHLGEETLLCEYTVNSSPEDVLYDLYSQKADVYCFSLYIFNRTFTMKIMSSLKKLVPSAIFIVGGPEGSADDEEILKKYSYVDFVSLGEGEMVLTSLLSKLISLPAVDVKKEYIQSGGSGVSFIYNEEFFRLPNNTPICNLDETPFPYSEEDLLDSNRIIYYETSRGCPFFCTYCCSGNESGVRSFSLHRIFNDIDRLMRYNLRQVKLVDRTFNYDRKRALTILKHIVENHNGVTNFHLEITPWLIDDALLEFLSSVPTNIFRFEAGIQTTNPKTLKAINRNVSLDSYRDRLKAVIDMGFCVHLDLIAGLPYEDYHSFGRSYNEVISLDPEELQLGFLKVLKGTALADDTSHGIVCSSEPPYAILYNRYVTFEELESLRRIEALTDRYFNGNMARRAIRAAADLLFDGNVFLFLEGLSEYFYKKVLFGREWSVRLMYDIFAEYVDSLHSPHASDVIKALAFDFYSYGKQSLFPHWLEQVCVCDHTLLTDLLKDDERILSLMSPLQKDVYLSREPKKWFRNGEAVVFNNGSGEEKYLFLYCESLDRNNCMIKL